MLSVSEEAEAAGPGVLGQVPREGLAVMGTARLHCAHSHGSSAHLLTFKFCVCFNVRNSGPCTVALL